VQKLLYRAMVSVRDVPPNLLIKELVDRLKAEGKITPPAWAPFVKTGASKERQPLQSDWWWTRLAAILRTVSLGGPLGVERIRSKYGGKKNRGHKPERFYKGSGAIVRNALKQLEGAGLLKSVPKKGRVIAPAGQAMLDSASNAVGAKLGIIKPKK